MERGYRFIGSPRPSIPAWGWAALCLLAIPVFAWISGRFIFRPDWPHGDFFTFWLGGRMVWLGQDPYSSALWLAAHQQFQQAWIPNPVFIYPLPLAVLLAPLGMLPLESAYVVWITLAELLILLTVLLAFRPVRYPQVQPYVLPFLAGCFLFRPTLVILRNGQLGAVLLFFLALALYFFERKKPFAGGVFLGLLALKPPLGLLIPGLVAAWLLFRKDWKGLAGMLSAGVGLAAIGLARDPGWMGSFIGRGQQKLLSVFGYSPTVWGLAGAACRNELTCTLAAGGTAALILVAGFAWFLWAKRDSLSISWVIGLAVPVGLLVLPYLWAYDQILLILPLALVVRSMAMGGSRFLSAATLMILVGVFALVLLVLADRLQRDHWSALVSGLALGLVLWRATRTAPILASGSSPSPE